MKRKLRYIRYRICRDIYYADQCPMENRKNYNDIGKSVAMGAMMAVAGFGAMFILVLMA